MYANLEVKSLVLRVGLNSITHSLGRDSSIKANLSQVCQACQTSGSVAGTDHRVLGTRGINIAATAFAQILHFYGIDF